MASTIDIIESKPVQINNITEVSSGLILDKSNWTKVQLGDIAYDVNDILFN